MMEQEVELAEPDLPPLEDLEETLEPPNRRSRPRPRARARARTSGSSSPASDASRAAPTWEKEIRKGYTEAMVLVGGGTLLLFPVTGTTMVKRAPETADILVRLARQDDRVRAALLAVLRYGTFLQLATIIGSLGLATQVDFWLREQQEAAAKKRAPRPNVGIAPNNPAVKLLIGDVIAELGGSPGPQPPESTAPAPNGAGAPWAGIPTESAPAG